VVVVVEDEDAQAATRVASVSVNNGVAADFIARHA
jgi:hypothetical protein